MDFLFSWKCERKKCPIFLFYLDYAHKYHHVTQSFTWGNSLHQLITQYITKSLPNIDSIKWKCYKLCEYCSFIDSICLLPPRPNVKIRFIHNFSPIPRNAVLLVSKVTTMPNEIGGKKKFKSRFVTELLVTRIRCLYAIPNSIAKKKKKEKYICTLNFWIIRNTWSNRLKIWWCLIWFYHSGNIKWRFTAE